TLGIALAVGGIPAGADIPLAGLLLAFTCPIVYAVWIVLAARLGGERPNRVAHEPRDEGALPIAPMDVEGVPDGPDVITSSAIMTTATALSAAVLAILAGDSVSPADVPDGAWLAVMAFGTF